jgi:hypothetical protein
MDPFESLVAEFAEKAGLTLQSGKDGSVDLVVDGVGTKGSDPSVYVLLYMLGGM